MHQRGTGRWRFTGRPPRSGRKEDYRGIMGYKDLWMLKAHLDELGASPVDGKEVAS